MTTASEPVYVTSGLLRLTRPQLIGTMTGLLLAALLAAIDQTIVGTAEPRIIASLQGFDRYPWVATIYLLSSTVSVPIFASLSDRYGRKPFFMLGALLFTVASALCGASGDLTFLPIDGMGQLILFRGLQGIGGGMVTGILFTIVGDIFSPIERGKYQGLFAALFGVDAAGPVEGPMKNAYLQLEHKTHRDHPLLAPGEALPAVLRRPVVVVHLAHPLEEGDEVVDLLVGQLDSRRFARVAEADQSREVTVVEVGGVVGDFIAQVDQLRLQRRAQTRQVFVELRYFPGLKIARMFGHALAHFEGQIEPRKAGIAAF